MKALITVAIFGYLFLSCDKMECVEHDCNGAVPQYYQPVCGCNHVQHIPFYHRKETKNQKWPW